MVVADEDATKEKLPVRAIAILLGLFMYLAGSDVTIDKAEWPILRTVVHYLIAYGTGTFFLYTGLTGKPPKFMR